MARHSRTSGFARGLRSGVFAIVLVGFLALAIAVGVVPTVMRGAALTVLSGSMEPTYAPGDIVVAIPEDQYRIGDPVTFQPRSDDPTLVTHRVVAVTDTDNGRTYVTRGDANGDDDDPIVDAQVMGRVVYSIPALGYVQQAVGGNKGLLVAGIGFALIAYAAYTFAAAAVDRHRRRAPTGSAADTSTADPTPRTPETSEMETRS